MLNATINVHLDPSKGRYSEVLENIEEIHPPPPSSRLQPPSCLGGGGGLKFKKLFAGGVSENFAEFEGKFKIA